MTINSGQLQHALTELVRKHWGLFLAEGIVLVVLGLLAILIPLVATLAVATLLGWLFWISGVVGLITTFWHAMRPASGGRCCRRSSASSPASLCWPGRSSAPSRSPCC